MKLDRMKLIQLRATKDWTLDVAAKKLDVSKPVLQAAERGEDVSDLSAGKIANGYRVELSDLVAAEETASA